MPQVKQPPSLQNMAMDYLSTWLANRCDELSTEDSLAKLRELIDAIKENIGPFLPWQLSSEFHKEFLYKYEALHIKNKRHGDVFRKAVLEVIMDRKIIGLRCEGSIVASLAPKYANRLQGLRFLDLSCYWNGPSSLDNFHLQDLTTFIFRKHCRNDNLETIGRNCSKLVSIDVSRSENVTNEGLRCLTSCTRLRIVDLAFCKVSKTGISEFLAAHGKIETIRAWDYNEADGFDCISDTDSNVYPSINSFTIISNSSISSEEINTVVVKFPNLTWLGFFDNFSADLDSIKFLNKLTKLEFVSDSVHNLPGGFTWDDLISILRFIGVNITDLRTSCALCVTQSHLNSLFQLCSNIEHLELHYRPVRDREILLIPPFGELKALECRIPDDYRRRLAELKFTEILKLENLLIRRFYVTEESIKSMILDRINFPKLKELKISKISRRRNAIDSITQLANANNLDFKITKIF